MKKDNRLVILKDTRESVQSIYNYSGKKWADKVLMIRTKLPVGDFSCMGNQNLITVERKTLDDLCGSMGNNRARFERMWERANDLKIEHRFLMVEAKFEDLINGNYRSEIHPNALIGSLMSWSIKYKFSFFVVPTVADGEMCIYYLMKNYIRLKGLDRHI